MRPMAARPARSARVQPSYTTARSRPSRLARYSARSARRIASEVPVSPGTKRATPPLADSIRDRRRIPAHGCAGPSRSRSQTASAVRDHRRPAAPGTPSPPVRWRRRRARRRAAGRRSAAARGVAGQVPVAIVDPLEEVQVQHQRGEGRARIQARGVQLQAAHAPQDLGPVPAAGQAVHRRHPGDRFLRPPAFGGIQPDVDDAAVGQADVRPHHGQPLTRASCATAERARHGALSTLRTRARSRWIGIVAPADRPGG